ncbi:MAG TPA: hypothetical protein VJA94_09235 [Candidatus Angelobacter sp.]
MKWPTTASADRTISAPSGQTRRGLLRSLPGLLLALPAAAQRHSRVTLPFESVEGLILLTIQANQKTATLVLDTGSVSTFVSPEIAGVSNPHGLADLRKSQNTMLIAGKAAVRSVTLSLDGDALFVVPVMVITLSELSHRIGRKLDGILGQSFLHSFHSITIDYKTSHIEFAY